MVFDEDIPQLPAPLDTACITGDLATAKLLYHELIASDPAAKIPTLIRMGIISAIKAHTSILTFCFSQGLTIDLNHCNNPLIYACYASDSIDIYKIFLANGMPINHTLELNTPLVCACDHGEVELVRFLLDEGYDPNNPYCGWYYTPLVWAIVGRHPSLEIVELLLERGIEVKETGALIAAIDEGNIAAVDILLRHGEKTGELFLEELEGEYDGIASWSNDDVGTALFKAAAAGQAEIVDMLLDKGADPTFRNKKGMSVVDIAEEKGHWGIAGEVRGWRDTG